MILKGVNNENKKKTGLFGKILEGWIPTVYI
jgi:hypothetical protein